MTSISEILQLDSLRTTFDDFSQTTGYPARLIAYPQEEELIRSGWRRPFDTLLLEHTQRATQRQELVAERSSSETRSRQAEMRVSDNGIAFFEAPIEVASERVASVSIGPVLIGAAQAGHEAAESNAAGDAVSTGKEPLDLFVVSQTSAEDSLWLLTGFVVTLVEQGLLNTELRGEIEPLERAKNFAENAIESLPGIFYVFDTAGRFFRWNSKFEKVTGYSGDEVAKMTAISRFTRRSDRGAMSASL